METKLLLVVILVTIGGAFGTVDTTDAVSEQCKTDFQGPYLASFASGCPALTTLLSTYGFPFVDLSTADGLANGKQIAVQILTCAGHNFDAEDKLNAGYVVEIINQALEPNARKVWKGLSKDGATSGITQTSYLLMNPDKTGVRTMSDLKDKCQFIADRKTDGSFVFTKAGNNNSQIGKLEKLASQISNSAPGSSVSSDGDTGAPGSNNGKEEKGPRR